MGFAKRCGRVVQNIESAFCQLHEPEKREVQRIYSEDATAKSWKTIRTVVWLLFPATTRPHASEWLGEAAKQAERIRIARWSEKLAQEAGFVEFWEAREVQNTPLQIYARIC